MQKFQSKVTFCCIVFWYLDTCFLLYQQHHHENGETDTEMEEFVATLKMQVEIFVNRMKSNSSRGRSIANDSSVQTLFMNITAMHSRLLKHIQQQDDSRGEYKVPSHWEFSFIVWKMAGNLKPLIVM
jgi:hypothetical protein